MKNITQSKEDYLRVLLELSEGGTEIRSIDIAYALGFSRASVSRMVKILGETGYLEKDPYGKITLTEKGYDIAALMKRRRNLIKDFLKDVLGVDPATAAREACKIEHSISEETEKKLKKLVISNKEVKQMKIALPVNEKSFDAVINKCFGRATFFIIYNTHSKEIGYLDHKAVAAQGGGGFRAAQALADNGVKVIITPQCGENAEKLFKNVEVLIYKAILGSIRDNIDAYQKDQLSLL
ncbi:NifB/NifX family molybdenum-iron cluster-binding protein [Sinanaerobacter chloroacetimidivorans]|uniref:Helix-turn-helix domain-containing protein n=1 Tax=Sinanaerobacter chloroacetimidivorans TaxID=2818044 RepID=A0A8J7VY09_9FIRM|nr:NifB/NifX family molybdenum-iron cluster-binding protein [Sinanaerobacter chloroacetimidivorans]MBR0597162.1 helix-turn-helix domain-containing protein [Sinanaerobacter chloroacetimidivorans]